ncbi:MAG: hypothetical protein II453_02915 [Alphaproteobacteria bacterium]|jgi:hypothetical protein|nr:hypothetical protein [Alphaproteobacteria bacterium]
MKKIVISIFVAIVAFVAVSCDTKSCKCYIYNGVNTPYREIEYVDEGSSCSTLDYSRGSQYRICTEYNEPDIDPTQIGREYKK